MVGVSVLWQRFMRAWVLKALLLCSSVIAFQCSGKTSKPPAEEVQAGAGEAGMQSAADAGEGGARQEAPMGAGAKSTGGAFMWVDTAGADSGGDPLPEELRSWTCALALYGDGTCHCGCGVVDSDCADETVESCEICDATWSCSNDECPGFIKAVDNAVCAPAPPQGWTCARALYGDGKSCDCGCGVLDPDCGDGEIERCDTCDSKGSCSSEACPGSIEPAINRLCKAPEGWTCLRTAYADGLWCHCGCGIPDPDCKGEKGSLACAFCASPGSCNPIDTLKFKECPGWVDRDDNTQCSVVAGWTCDPAWYKDGQTCHCGCGIVDPDCTSSSASACDVCYGTGSCGADICPSNLSETNNAVCSVPAGWTCPNRYYGDGEKCHCGCGARDSDCESADVDSCDECNAEGSCSQWACPGRIDPLSNELCGQPRVPSGWTCAPELYADWDYTCHCGCGVVDVDCLDSSRASCASCIGCSGGQCGEIDDKNNASCGPPPPAGWTCPSAFYDDARDDCDCGCGVPDPDCKDATLASCDYCLAAGSCSTTACEGNQQIDPADNAVCKPSGG